VVREEDDHARVEPHSLRPTDGIYRVRHRGGVTNDELPSLLNGTLRARYRFVRVAVDDERVITASLNALLDQGWEVVFYTASGDEYTFLLKALVRTAVGAVDPVDGIAFPRPRA